MKRRNFGIILAAFFLLLLVLANALKFQSPFFFGSRIAPRNVTTGSSSVVARVIDGDTIELSDGSRVRYIGMNTPETVDPRKPVECFGKEAAAKNRELVQDKTVRLEKDVENRDKYGRLLRYVWVSSTFINLELVREGYARIYTFPPNVKYYEQFLAAEREAREAKRGLWGGCTS